MGRGVGRVAVIVGEHGQADALFLGAAAQRLVRRRAVQPEQEVQAGVLLGDVSPVGQRPGAEGGDDRVALLMVALAHTVQVLFIVAAGDELGQGVLLEGGDGAGVKAQLLPEGGQQRRGQDHEADADGGGDGLGEGVEVDDVAAAVDGEQGGDGAAHEAELAVVIVLQNAAARRFPRPGQQLLAAGDGHDQAGGVMVAGGDMHHVGVGVPEGGDGQARLVQGDEGHGGAAAAVDAGDLAVAGVFHGVAAFLAQELDQQAVQHLRARADDDLLRGHVHAPELAEVGGHGIAEGQRALGRRGVEQARPLLQNGAAHEPRPDSEGEVLRVDGVGDKVEKPAALLRLEGGSRRRRRGGWQGRLDGGDEVALLLHAGEVALGHELLVGGLDGDDADLQVGGQGTLGRQLCAAGETA